MSTLGGRLARWSLTKRGAATLFGLVFAVGVVLIILGDTIGGLSDYNKSVFAAIGIALVVVAPVAAAERWLRIAVAHANTRVDKANERADQATARANQANERAERAAGAAEEARQLVSSLQQQLSVQLNQPRLEVADLEQKAMEGDFESLVSLYDEARKHHRIYENGIRVETRFPNCNWAKMTVEREKTGEVLVRFSFEEEPFKPIGVSADWTTTQSAPVFLGTVNRLLQDANRAPDKETFINPGLLTLFAHALRMAIDLHTGPDGEQGVDEIVLFIGEEWAVTESQLVNLSPPLLRIPAQQFEALRADFAPQGGSEELLAAMDVAEKAWEGLRWDRYQTLARLG